MTHGPPIRAARVGTSGAREQLAGAVLEATDPGGPAADCNAGFSRPERPLLVVFVTDEEDSFETDGSSGGPKGWHAKLLQHRSGPVMVLGLISDLDLPDPACSDADPFNPGGAYPSPRLRAFVELFGEQGRTSSVCEPDYAPAFEGIAELLSLTCG